MDSFASFLRALVGVLSQFFSSSPSQDASSTPSAPGASSPTPSAPRSPSSPRPTPPRGSSAHSPSPAHSPTPAHSPSHAHSDAGQPRPRTSIREASIDEALPSLSYSPIMDGDADPGEVVWTWVPYLEDPSVGKDRPVVVIGAHEEGVYVLQLTSKDHTRDAAQEAHEGRYWLSIGSGPWDSKGRPSQVRLDRVLWVRATDVRREGSILPRQTWQHIVDALKEHHHAHR